MARGMSPRRSIGGSTSPSRSDLPPSDRASLETAVEICESIEEDARVLGRLCHPQRGEGRASPAFKRASEKLRDSGTVSFGVEEAYDGVELPSLAASIIMQMIARADAGLMTIVGLQSGVAEDIQKYGSEEIRVEYLPRFARGRIQGAMDLTEPEAGSDLGGITIRATQEGERYFLDGHKTFIPQRRHRGTGVRPRRLPHDHPRHPRVRGIIVVRGSAAPPVATRRTCRA